MLPSVFAGPRPPGSSFPGFKRRRLEENSPPHPAESNSDSEDDVVVPKRRHRNEAKPFSSPDVSKTSSDVDSPYPGNVKRRRAAALNTSDEMEGDAVSDDDFQSESLFTRRTAADGAERKRVQRGEAKHTKRRRGRQFLDEEAALSVEEGADVSSDEEDGEEQNRSLEGFVVDNTHLSQGLND